MKRRLLKFCGSKQRTIDQVLPLLPECDVFEDLMCGSGTVALAMLEAGKCRRVVLADVNARLIQMFRHAHDCAAALAAVVRAGAKRYNEGVQEVVYAEWVATMNSGKGGLPCSAALILSNRLGFNGLYRENAKGQYNVAWGKYPKVDGDALAESVLELGAVIRGRAEIRAASYDEHVTLASGRVTYFDGPYDGTFGAYHAVKWGKAEQGALARHAKMRVSQGGRVFASNADTTLVREFYQGSRIHEIGGHSIVSCDPAMRGHRKELLIEVVA